MTGHALLEEQHTQWHEGLRAAEYGAVKGGEGHWGAESQSQQVPGALCAMLRNSNFIRKALGGCRGLFPLTPIGSVG